MSELIFSRENTEFGPQCIYRGKQLPPICESTMSSVDAPNSSLAPSAEPHTFTHSTLSVHRNVHAEQIELSEVNTQLPQKRSNLDVHDVHISQTNKSSKFRERIQFFALCWTIFLAGWGDSSTGPLLPRIQSTYHVLSLLRAPYI